MSPKKPVYFLNYLCQNSIVDYLVDAVSQEDFQEYEELSRYFANATIDIIEELLTLLMTYEDVRSTIKFKCFKILFRKGVRHLDCSVISQRYHKDIAKAIKSNGSSLKYLDLRRFSHENLEDFLGELSNLKVLLAPHIATNNVVVLVNKMKNLTTLNISNVEPLNLSGELLRTLKCDSLTFLDIGLKGKLEFCSDMDSSEVLADMLKNLTNLRHVKTYSYAGLAILSLNTRFPEYVTKLVAIKDTGTSKQVLKAMSSSCPELDSVELIKPAVDDLKRLKKVKNVKVNYPNNALSSYLVSSRLQALNLTCSLNFNPIVEAFFANLCNLKCKEVKISLPTPRPIFRQLQIVELFSCDVAKRDVKALLTESPQIKRFVLTDEVYLKDIDIAEICAHAKLEHLEEFWLSRAECLTVASVKLLIEHCKNLRVIGQLGRWAVESYEVNLLRWESHLWNNMVNIFNYCFFKL